MAGVDAGLPETVDDEDIEKAIQEFENDAMDAAGIDEMNETFELEIELVKVFPMAKKKYADRFPTTNPCPLVKLSDGRMEQNHSHLPISSYPLECRTRKPAEPKARRPKCHGIANPVNAALNRR